MTASTLSAADKIKMALDWVAKREPIAIPTVLTRWAVKVNADATQCPTMQTNGRVLQYNPAFVDKLSFSGTKAITLHEVGHVLSQHQHRRDGRNPKGWNIAADLALNDMLYRGYLAAYDGNANALHAELIDGPLAGCFAGFTRFKDYPRNQDAETYYSLAKAEADAEKAKQEAERQKQQEERDKERAERGESDDSDEEDFDDQDGDEAGEDDEDEQPAKPRKPGKEKSQKADSGDEDGKGGSDDESEGDGAGDGEGEDGEGEGEDSKGTGSGGDPSDFDEEGPAYKPDTGTPDPFAESEEAGDGVPQGKGKDPFDEDPFANFPDVPGGIEDAPVEATLRDDEANAVLETLLGGDGFSPLGLGNILSGLLKRIEGDPEAAAEAHWKQTLEQFLRVQHAASWRYDRPSRRHSHRTDILLPARRGRSKTKGIVIVDSSGSMSDAECDKALAHTAKILALFPQSTVTLVTCDTAVRASKEYRACDFPIREWDGWKGRGGTNLNPAFQWAKEHSSKADWVVCVSDSEWRYWEAIDPKLPVLWVVTRPTMWRQDEGKKVPFGKVVAMHAIK